MAQRAAALRKKADAKKSKKTSPARGVVEKAPPFLKKLDAAVREHFAEAMSLPAFLASAGQLTLAQRKLIVQQALILIEQNYVHLPLKRAMHTVDPVQRLKLLLQSLETSNPTDLPLEVDFHREMTDIFTSVRDLHTNYLLPAPFNGMVAFLPFMVEDYVEDGKRKYIASHLAPGFKHPTFVEGVEIVYWNGVPIDRAVANQAQRYAGSNRDARHARGVQTLTTRALKIATPPDEEWVVVGYKPATGKLAELRVDWQINPPPSTQPVSKAAARASASVLGIDLEQDIIQQMRMALFAPSVVASRSRLASARAQDLGPLESRLPQIFQAKEVETPSGTFGHLRIRTFNHLPVSEFVDEFIRLITALPKRGLIIDVRGNGGGVILNGETILQTLTPRRIEPESVQFINTPLNLEICRNNGSSSRWTDLSTWVESLEQALRTGATYSAGFPITDREACNAIGQKYFGPVVVITDALCYSTTDIFAAGFQDHEIGPVLGVHASTGAGGANVWEHRFFVSDILPGRVYQALPNGAGMRVAIRRSLRLGKRSGAPVEDLGVESSNRHFMTKRDLLENNVDLLNKAGELLAALPARELVVDIKPQAGSLVVSVRAMGVTSVDAYFNGRPMQSVELERGQGSVTLPKPASPDTWLEIQAFDGDRLVGRHRAKVT